MNPIDFQLTESVQGAGGAGFSVPIFRAGMPVDATTATPQARSGLGIDYLAGIEMDGLDPVSAMRDAFDQEVANTYEWIAGVVEKGYDPTKIDMSDPNSKAVYLDFMKKRQGLKRMADDLKLSGTLKKQGDLIVDPTADAATVMGRGFKSNLLDIVKQQNSMFSAAGYDNEQTYGMAMEEYQVAGQQLLDAYLKQRELVKDNPDLLRKLESGYSEAKAARRPPMFTGGINAKEAAMIENDRRALDLREKEYLLNKEGQEEGISQSTLNTKVTLQPSTGTAISYTSPRLTVPIVSVASARGFTLGGDGFVGETLPDIKVDRYEILPIDASGKPIVDGVQGKYSSAADVKGFKVFAIGNAKKGDDIVPFYISADITKNKHKGSKAALVSKTIDEYNRIAKEMKPTAVGGQQQSATKAGGQGQVTNVSNIFQTK